MASILDRYGIKEVADVTFYEIDENGRHGAPVLYLDTLKVSTIEQTAENTSARGGKGNPELITWDYGKEITVTLEDALFSAKSMAIMFGDKDGAALATSGSVLKTWISTDGKKITDFTINGQTITAPTDITYYDAEGKVITSDAVSSATNIAYATGTVVTKDSVTIDINPETFPGTYYITGDTYARSENTGKDEFFQFVIAKAKVQSEVTLTMEAEGDPSTFSMNLKVLRPKTGPMMQLIKYNIEYPQG